MDAIQKMNDNARRETFARTLAEFCESLGLVEQGPAIPLNPTRAGHTPLLRRYHWPQKRSGSDRDLQVMVMIHGDGSWCEFLESGELSVKNIVSTMRTMANAGAEARARWGMR